MQDSFTPVWVFHVDQVNLHYGVQAQAGSVPRGSRMLGTEGLAHLARGLLAPPRVTYPGASAPGLPHIPLGA